MNEDKSLEDFKNLSEKVNDLSRSVEGLEKSVRDVLRFLTPVDEKIILFDKVFKNPSEYNFNFMNGLTIGGLIKKKEADGVISRNGLRNKLLISSEPFDNLLADRSLPNASVFSRLIDILGVPKSDLMVCKANTFLKIQSESKIKIPTLEEILKPYVHMETLSLVEKIAEKGWSVLAFFGNLFVENISDDFFSVNPKDYKNKSNEEVARIMELGKQPNITLLECPVNRQNVSGLQFALEPTKIIHLAMTGYSKIFPRVGIEGDPKFYKIAEQGSNEYWLQLQDLENGETKTIHREEFGERWQKANYEMLLILPAGKIFSGPGSFIENIVNEVEHAFDGDSVKELKSNSSLLDSKEIIKDLFKTKRLLGNKNDLLDFVGGSEMNDVASKFKKGEMVDVVVDGKIYKFPSWWGDTDEKKKKLVTKKHFERRAECREETMKKFKGVLKKLED